MNSNPQQSFRAAVFAIIASVLSIALMGGVLFFAYRIIGSLIGRLATLNVTVATALITGSVTVIVSVSAVALGRYFEKRKEVEQAFRERRLEAYGRFISQLAAITKEPVAGTDFFTFLNQLNREILLWAGPRLLKAYITFLEGVADAGAGKTFFKLEDFYRAMREDLGHSNVGLKRGDTLRLVLKADDLSRLLIGMKHDPNFRVLPAPGPNA